MSNNFQRNFDKNICEHTTLDKAKTNVPYIITSCSLPEKLQTRFAELGFVVGAKVVVVKTAPLGDPLEVRVMGYSLCARAKELRLFTVKKVDDE